MALVSNLTEIVNATVAANATFGASVDAANSAFGESFTDFSSASNMPSNVIFEEGLTNFSFSIYEALDRTGNEFLSPFSISAALLLLSLGAEGTTRNQIADAIFEYEMPDNFHDGYSELQDKLSNRTSDVNSLSVANRLFASDSIDILDNFTSGALEYYGSDVQSLNFTTDPESSRLVINDWVASQTKDKIRDMLPKGVVNTNTAIVLANAIYFKGQWETPFDPKRTSKMNFFVDSATQTQVDMMSNKFKALSAEDTDHACKVLKLPFAGEGLSMVFVLPNDGNGLSSLETILTVDEYKKMVSLVEEQETVVKIPKFIMEAEYDLRPVLEGLGIVEVFGAAADFSNLVPANAGDVFVSDARHKAYIEVNEEGAEAAAATTIMMTRTSLGPPPFEFVADHPFLFFIQDDETGTILFLGRFANP